MLDSTFQHISTVFQLLTNTSSQCWTQRFNTKFALHISTINNHNKPTSYNCMIRWGTQPNHEFDNRRSKLLHSSWHASQRYNNFTVINFCYLSITINTLRVLSIDFSTFATGRADSYNWIYKTTATKLKKTTAMAANTYECNPFNNIISKPLDRPRFLGS